MATPRREILRRPDVPRRRSARQALAMIPDSTSTNISPGIDPGPRRYSSDSWNSSQSPDELVIQKRGRRKSIVWSPDIDSIKKESIFSDRTPKTSPSKHFSALISRGGTPRKRLLLGDSSSSSSDVEMLCSSPEKRERHTKQFSGSLANGLRGLSHEQLVKMLMDLVSMQEESAIGAGDRLRDVILRKMPVADIKPLREKLICLRQNVYASLVSSNINESDYNRAFVHLDNFQRTLKEQGHNLVESQHWSAVNQYVFAAWSITKDLPEWKNQGMHSTTQKCYKHLTEFCMQALKYGKFSPAMLIYCRDKLESMMDDYEDIKVCLNYVNEARA